MWRQRMWTVFEILGFERKEERQDLEENVGWREEGKLKTEGEGRWAQVWGPSSELTTWTVSRGEQPGGPIWIG